MERPITGGCACGAIRYECDAEPVLSLNCPELPKFPRGVG